MSLGSDNPLSKLPSKYEVNSFLGYQWGGDDDNNLSLEDVKNAFGLNDFRAKVTGGIISASEDAAGAGSLKDQIKSTLSETELQQLLDLNLTEANVKELVGGFEIANGAKVALIVGALDEIRKERATAMVVPGLEDVDHDSKAPLGGKGPGGGQFLG